jgi:hypothetical protein
MNFEAARKASQRASRTFLKQQVMPCPFMNTGLIVIVYREDDGEGIPGAHGAISGTGRIYKEERVGKNKPPRYLRSDKPIDRKERTDASGIARFLPCNPGEFHVTAVDLPDPDKVLGKPREANVRVPAQDCPICVIPVPVLARPEIMLRFKHDSSGMPGVRVKIGEEVLDERTDGAGLASWKGEPMNPAHYAVAFTFDGDAPHRFFDQANQPVDAPAIDLPVGKHRFTFYAEQLSWLTFDVVRDEPGVGPKRLDKARLTLQWPGDGASKPFETDGAPRKIADIPQVQGPATRCEVVTLELPDDGEPEVYEFVELNTA